jgi:hypothetical protein
MLTLARILECITPDCLRRRNILGGDRGFANKYETRPVAADDV